MFYDTEIENNNKWSDKLVAWILYNEVFLSLITIKL
jgi:hypothetical protein